MMPCNSTCTRRVCAAVAILGLALAPGCGGSGSGGPGDGWIKPFWMNGGVAVADLNGDSLDDVLYVSTYIEGTPPHRGTLNVSLRQGPAAFAPRATYDIGPDPWTLSVADMDGDGRPDVVTTHPQAREIAVLLQDPQVPGRFRPATKVGMPPSPYELALGDANGDGRSDLVLSAATSSVTLAPQDPARPGSFAGSQVLASSGSTWGVALGDVNGDGWPDVVAATDAGVAVWFATTARGGFGAAVTIASGLNPYHVAIADVDRDGRSDIVVLNRGDSGNSYEGASLQVLRQNPIAPNAFNALPPRPMYRYPRGLLVTDLDRNGWPDAVVIWDWHPDAPASSRVAVLLGSSSQPGTFVPAGEYQGPDLASFLAAGDVDGDGWPDIVVNRGKENLDAGAFLQRAEAAGTFRPWRSLP